MLNFTSKPFIAKFILVSCLGGIFAVAFYINTTANTAKETQKIKEIISKLPKLQKGDLIFRQGIGGDSFLIQTIQNSPFSHLGMIVSTNPVMIIHATTNDNPKSENQVIQSSLDDFIARSRQIAIKRYPLTFTQQEQVANRITKFLGKKFILAPTNTSINSAQEEYIYCTTLIALALKDIEKEISYTHLEVPFFSGEYLLPKSFYESKASTTIFFAKIN